MSTIPDYTNVNMACPYCLYDVRHDGCAVCKRKPEPETITEMVRRIFKRN